MRSRALRITLVLLAIAGVVAGLVTLYFVRPAPNTIYPPCPFYTFTRLHCPACGTTRSTHALLHGRVAQAFAYNPISPWLLPILGVYALYRAARFIRGQPREPRRVSNAWLWVMFAVILAFWIARNIPVKPFTWIAPHELENTRRETRLPHARSNPLI